MAAYYYLINDTKKKVLYYGGCIKKGSIRDNPLVHFTFTNYMLENEGDVIRLLCDESEAFEVIEDLKERYTNSNLQEYAFKDKAVIAKLKFMEGSNEF